MLEDALDQFEDEETLPLGYTLQERVGNVILLLQILEQELTLIYKQLEEGEKDDNSTNPGATGQSLGKPSHQRP